MWGVGWEAAVRQSPAEEPGQIFQVLQWLFSIRLTS